MALLTVKNQGHDLIPTLSMGLKNFDYARGWDGRATRIG